MLTRVLKRTKNEIKLTKKWENAVNIMVEKHEARKKLDKLAKETKRMIENIHRRNRELRREGKFPQVIKDIKRK